MNYVPLLVSLTFLSSYAIAADLQRKVNIKYYKTENEIRNDTPSAVTSVYIKVGMPWRDIQDALRKKFGAGDLRHGSLKMDQWRKDARVTAQDFNEIDMYTFWSPMPDDQNF